MKPRTKLQHKVFNLSESLPKLNQEVKDWAFKVCMVHKGFATKTRVICMDCGETFSPTLVKRKRANCPHCDTKLKIEKTRKRTDSQTELFATAEIVGEFQVVRNYQITCIFKKGKEPWINIFEILQYWIQDNGKITMVGHLHTNFDSWGGDWSIRIVGTSYYANWKYRIWPFKYHPKSKFKKEYRKYGIDHRLDGLNVLDAIRIVPNNPYAETLLKAKQYSLLSRCNSDSSSIRFNWKSIKILLRNRYQVKESDLFVDYLSLLKYFNKDISNAHYVCPKNLRKEHDRLMFKKQRIIAKRREIEKRRQVERAQYKFEKHIKKFIGLQFSDGQFTIKVLETVREFMEESDKLKHCLFTNDYHAKTDSLILSARLDGEPIETIEVSLSNMKIIQSRGMRNVPTDHHKQIVALVRKNLSKIEKRMKPVKVAKMKNLREYEHAV